MVLSRFLSLLLGPSLVIGLVLLSERETEHPGLWQRLEPLIQVEALTEQVDGSTVPDRGSLPTMVWRSELEGRPVGELIFPALLGSLSRVLPALCLSLLVARLLALPDQEWAANARRAIVFTSGVPLFLGGYALIIVINRAVVLCLPEHASPPGWFALPLGDGEPHLFRWGLEVFLLTLGDGALGTAVLRLRRVAVQLWEAPFVLASRLNGQQGRALERHLNRALAPLALELLPAMLGSLIVLELLFVEQGLGRLLAERIESHDLPVLMSISVLLLALNLSLRGLGRLFSSHAHSPGLAEGGSLP